MIEFDEHNNKIVLKLVYYGPALSGKTTNLLSLHEQLASEQRGDLMMLDTTDDRTIYFDMLPFFYVSENGMKIKLKVFTVPGQVRHDATRKAVLQRADAVVFVADSQSSMMNLNAESFANLEQNLSFVGISIDKIPLVIQFNKRDMQDITAESEIIELWSGTGFPVVMASALEGWGVVETFKIAVEKLFDHVDEKLKLVEKYKVDKNDFISSVVKL